MHADRQPAPGTPCMMVEAGAKEVSEEEMLDAILFAHEEIKKIVAFQDEIVAEIGKDKARGAPGHHRRRREGRRARVTPWRSRQWVFDTFDRQERQSPRGPGEGRDPGRTLPRSSPAGKAKSPTRCTTMNKEVMRKQDPGAGHPSRRAQA